MENFIKNNLNRIVNGSLKNKIERPENNTVLKLSSIENGIETIKFFDCKTLTETESAKEKHFLTCKYNTSKDSFCSKRMKLPLKDYKFIFMEADMLYLADIEYDEKISFYHPSGILNENPLKKPYIETHLTCKKDSVIIYDLRNEKIFFSHEFKSGIRNDIKIFSAEEYKKYYNQMYMETRLNSLKDKKIKWFYPDYMEEDIIKVLNENNLSEKIIQINKKYFSEKQGDDKQSEIIKLINDNSCIGYEKINDSMNRVLNKEENYSCAYFELLSNKDILIVIKNISKKPDQNALARAIIIKKDQIVSIENLILRFEEKIILNSEEEIRNIFNGSNIAELNIPDIVGYNQNSPETKLCYFPSVMSSTDKFNLIFYIELLKETPVLYEMLQQYGVELIFNIIHNIYWNGKRSAFNKDEIDLYIENKSRFEMYKSKNMLGTKRWSILESSFPSISDEEMEFICDWFSDLASGFSFLGINKIKENISCLGITFREYADYITNCVQNQCMSKNDCINFYNEYVKNAANLMCNLKDKSILFPSELKKQVRISGAAKSIACGINASTKIYKVYNCIKESLNYQSDKYLIESVNNAIDFFTDAAKHLCITTFIRKFKKYVNPILLLKPLSDLSKSLYLIEVDINTNYVINICSWDNKTPDEPDVLEFINSWLREKGLIWISIDTI